MTKIFADGADLSTMAELSKKTFVRGFTTNPSLIKSSGIYNYLEFAKNVLSVIDHHPVSFEVFANDEKGMIEQALKLASLGDNVYVKIPITNIYGETTRRVIENLYQEFVKVNVTAVFTLKQVLQLQNIFYSYNATTPRSIISVFAGRIADTGIDPLLVVKEIVDLFKQNPCVEILWASSRELLNINQANSVGCHIITLTNDLIKKYDTFQWMGKSLEDYSLETVRQFYRDSKGYEI